MPRPLASAVPEPVARSRAQMSAHELHGHDRAALREVFGLNDVPPERQHIVCTSKRSQAVELARYLGVPESQVLHYKTSAHNRQQARGDDGALAWREGTAGKYIETTIEGSSTYRALCRSSENYCATHDVKDGALIVLGSSMSGESDDRGALDRVGNLRSGEFARLLREFEPQHLTVFACSSQFFAHNLARSLRRPGHDIHAHWVQDGVFVNPDFDPKGHVRAYVAGIHAMDKFGGSRSVLGSFGHTTFTCSGKQIVTSPAEPLERRPGRDET